MLQVMAEDGAQRKNITFLFADEVVLMAVYDTDKKKMELILSMRAEGWN